MYNISRKQFRVLRYIIALAILLICILPMFVCASVSVDVCDNKIDETSLEQEYNIRAGIIKQLYMYSSKSLSGYTQDNGVIVTASQQVFEEEKWEPQVYCVLTAKEEYMLSKLVACEAGNQSLETKEAVVMVVLNRVKDDRFPNTVEEVITENHNGVYQFSPCMPDGSFWYKEPTEESWEAVDNVICGMSNQMDCEALFFEALPQAEGSWHQRNLDFLFQSDDTRFYK